MAARPRRFAVAPFAKGELVTAPFPVLLARHSSLTTALITPQGHGRRKVVSSAFGVVSFPCQLRAGSIVYLGNNRWSQS
jgi:hypothetical protein